MVGSLQLKFDLKINGWYQFLNSKKNSSPSIIQLQQKQLFLLIYLLKSLKNLTDF